AAKEEEEDDDNMGNFDSDGDDGDDSDKDMGVDDEDLDEVDNLKLQKLSARAKALRNAEAEDDDSDDDFTDDDDEEELQSPIDEVDPFVFFVDTVKALQATDPLRFEKLSRALDFHYLALAEGVAQHAEFRRVEIEKEKLAKAAAAS
ncbi:hypothetical protein M569_17008, partial [Genlisea aurea]